jgi:hypothetical protein
MCARQQEEGAMIEATGVDHVILHVSDVRRSKTFCTEIPGMTAYREEEELVFLRTGLRGVAALFKKAGDNALTGATILTIWPSPWRHEITKRSRPNWSNTASLSPATRVRSAASISAIPTATACS